MPMQRIIDRFLRSEKSHEFKINNYEFSILTILASYMGNKLNCWPSFKSLAKDTRMSEKSIERYILKLENKNLIKITRKMNKNNEYEFTEVIHNCRLSTASQTVGTVSQSVLAPSHSLSNNINNNINNKSCYKLKENYTPSETAPRASKLLEEFNLKENNKKIS